MKTDKYGIEIKVGDWVQLISMTGMEFSSEHSGKIYSVKEIKTKFLFLSKKLGFMRVIYYGIYLHITTQMLSYSYV